MTRAEILAAPSNSISREGMNMMNRAVFFSSVRRSIYGGNLTVGQVDGFDTLLDAWEAKHGGEDIRLLAYCLATAHHETAATIQPIEEYGTDARANRLYGPEGKDPVRAKSMGNTRRGDGARYKGRGYVQLTWKDNYRRAGKILGDDLVGRPDLAMRPEYAARILFQGCMEGWFTSHKLSDHIAGSKTDYLNARRVVNGTDKARMIAGYAVKFEAALSDALAASPPPTLPKPKPKPKPKGGWLQILTSILNAFKRR